MAKDNQALIQIQRFSINMVKKAGILTLIPTPIDDESPLEPIAFELLKKVTTNADFSRHIIVVEDHKPCRKRWLHWGLPREAIEHFVCYNEHTYRETCDQLLSKLQQGRNVYMMSDAGLPSFCDPGRQLVELCHQNNIKVTATPFANSFSLAVALSGFEHDSFQFHGFLPKKGSERVDFLKEMLRSDVVVVTMDAPYRLKGLLEQLDELGAGNREVFLALDLNMKSENLLRGPLRQVISQVDHFKREFVLLISPIKS